MAEEIIKTIENVDKLFSQIEVNGQVYKSDRYQAPAKSSAGSTRTQTAQGEDVEAVVLNNTQHDFRDGDATEAVEQLQAGLNAEVSTRQQNVNDLTDEVTALQQLLSTIQSRINEINVLIPSQASASNKLTDSNSVSSAISSATSPLSSAISGIEAKIPNQASAQNQLADKEFVNSSVTTNTANFLGTYTSMAQIEAIPNPTNNDYAFLEQTISAGNTVYKRYKYSSATNEWLFEYDLNNSSFTAEQWATINSGLTQASVESTASSIASTAVSAEATARANADNSLASDISSVSNTASSALTTAQSAQSTANSASSTASSALTTAQSAQSTANSADAKATKLASYNRVINYFDDLGYPVGSGTVSMQQFFLDLCTLLGLNADNPRAMVNLRFTREHNNSIYTSPSILVSGGGSYNITSYIGDLDYDVCQTNAVSSKYKEMCGIFTDMISNYLGCKALYLLRYPDSINVETHVTGL